MDVDKVLVPSLGILLFNKNSYKCSAKMSSRPLSGDSFI